MSEDEQLGYETYARDNVLRFCLDLWKWAASTHGELNAFHRRAADVPANSRPIVTTEIKIMARRLWEGKRLMEFVEDYVGFFIKAVDLRRSGSANAEPERTEDGAAPKPGRHRCHGLKKNGKRCFGGCLAGTAFCVRHQDQAGPTITAMADLVAALASTLPAPES